MYARARGIQDVARCIDRANIFCCANWTMHIMVGHNSRQDMVMIRLRPDHFSKEKT